MHNAGNDHLFRSRGTKKNLYITTSHGLTEYVRHCHSAGQTVALIAMFKLQLTYTYMAHNRYSL